MDNWFETAAHHMGDAYLNYSFKRKRTRGYIPHQRTQPETRDEIARCGVRTGRHSHLFAKAGITVQGLISVKNLLTSPQQLKFLVLAFFARRKEFALR